MDQYDKVQSFAAESGTLEDAAISAFNRDGVICLRNAISDLWLTEIEIGIRAALAGASTDLSVVKADSDKGRFSFSSQAWRHVPEFQRYIFDSPIADLSMQVLQSQTLTLFYDFLLIKEALSNSAETPWHQDHSFYPLNGSMVVNCWTALDPIPEETALRFWKGSHASGLVYRAVNFEDPSKPYKHARMTMPEIPNVDAISEAEILTTAMEPGDVLIFSSRVLHAAPGNNLDHRRAGFSVNWAGDDVTYQDIECLESYRDPGLATGQAITCEKFPLVRPC